MKSFIIKHKRPIFGGLLTAIFTGTAVFILGSLSGYEAKEMIHTSIPRIGSLFNTIILTSATILALLLTLLGISSGSNSKLKVGHYKQILTLAKFSSVLFITALIFYQFFNIPITESDNVPTSWFAMIYWFTLFTSSLLSGMLVAVILMLYSIIENIIYIVGFGEDHYLVYSDEDEIEEEKNPEE